ncbi:uncharacterized protein C8A04DRAFT_33173 [Dichotomopilus funicola]|uniref:NAD(P)-binding domain-containing protein n=1 Tax=Dichotomopilus funicola TaxID=1934379 RepID=A0AAN6UUB2_9PEZI|nr:hypothetical protein C8A04DRAFT_33173 [Dichotomopilus funicola]
MAKTILFLGATGGVGLSALRRALSAGHTCIALCRTPSNLTSQLPADLVPSESTTNNTSTNTNNNTNLHIITGNAHDPAAVTRCFSTVPSPIDTIVFSLGAYPTLRGMSDPHVCEKGMGVLLDVLRAQRAQRDNSVNNTTQKEDQTSNYQPPHLIAISTTGISSLGRDIPLLVVPLYKVGLHTAHEDKRGMERLVIAAGTSSLSSHHSSKGGQREGEGKGEGLVRFTLIRGSLYTSGPETEGLVRVGVEDVGKGVVEKRELGYTISREDVGKWVWEECIKVEGGQWVGKAVGVTY